jgi:thiol-disulfide isomerase/thioredoxin
MAKAWRAIPVALVGGLCGCGNISSKELTMTHSGTAIARLPVEGELPSLARATTWLNSPPLQSADLRGKVVLVDFWTYTCINWRRTLPYLRTWSQRYHDRGLIVIGVHTPEFSFEEEVENVRRAAVDQSIPYPIAVDSKYDIWNAFDNHYWPALYVIDAEGHIRHHQFGEGNYDQLEPVIEELLAEAGRSHQRANFPTIVGNGAEAPANWKNMRSPETYLGHGQSEGFASPQFGVLEREMEYTLPDRLHLNHWALAGRWVLGTESARSVDAGGRLSYRFHARDVHLVMAPANNGSAVRFRVFIDGEPPGNAHGVDIDERGNGTMDLPRMYQLVRQAGPITDRVFEIEFLDAGAEIYVLTFG